jgi:hypothetical protein
MRRRSSSFGCITNRRVVAAMLGKPSGRSLPSTRVRAAARNGGAFRLRTRPASAPLGTSRTWCNRFSIPQGATIEFEQPGRVGLVGAEAGDPVRHLDGRVPRLPPLAGDLVDLTQAGPEGRARGGQFGGGAPRAALAAAGPCAALAAAGPFVEGVGPGTGKVTPALWGGGKGRVDGEDRLEVGPQRRLVVLDRQDGIAPAVAHLPADVGVGEYRIGGDDRSGKATPQASEGRLGFVGLAVDLPRGQDDLRLVRVGGNQVDGGPCFPVAPRWRLPSLALAVPRCRSAWWRNPGLTADAKVSLSIARRISDRVLGTRILGRVKPKAVTRSLGRFRPRSTIPCRPRLPAIRAKIIRESTAERGGRRP